MKVSWGRLIAAALDQGYVAEDAVWVVLSTARRLETMSAADLGRREKVTPTLSEREVEVLTVIAAHDCRQRNAAPELGLSLCTVREYSRRIRAQLGVTSTKAAVRRAVELGLVADLEKAA